MRQKLSLELKKKLYTECQSFIDQKIDREIKAMDDIQKSANAETRSSMGDKYETGRAMIHLEKEKIEIQLRESMKLKMVIEQIDFTTEHLSVQPGSIVVTDKGNFFIAINCGEIEVDGDKFYTLSLASPIGKALFNKEIGDLIVFRDKNFEIINLI
ncbi:MAG: hypothetical protein JEY94_06755 [Melioribacteraceae bacterium]|nr:hypothetical protein [Melioribacteraceae bacterium]